MKAEEKVGLAVRSRKTIRDANDANDGWGLGKTFDSYLK